MYDYVPYVIAMLIAREGREVVVVEMFVYLFLSLLMEEGNMHKWMIRGVRNSVALTLFRLQATMISIYVYIDQ